MKGQRKGETAVPTRELMTWIPEQRRWTKRYCGRRYYVSARQLGCRNKEDSIQLANRWWADKQSEVDYALRVKLHRPKPMDDAAAARLGVPADLFADVRQLLEEALLHEEEKRKRGEPMETALPGIPDGTEVEIEIEDEPEDAEAIRRREIMNLLERMLFGADTKLPPAVAEKLTPARAAQFERGVKEIRGDVAAEPARTVQARLDEWLGKQRALVLTGAMKPDRYDNVRICLSHFASFVGEGADVSCIDAERLDEFHNFALSKIHDGGQGDKGGWSVSYAKEIFSNTRRFIRWLWEVDAIEMPRNLDTRFRFPSSTKKIETWTVAEVQEAIGAANGKMKLALLLMLNAGMTQRDVSDLRQDEVNWRDGVITRKRSKTRDREGTPTVSYKLWPITFALLKEHRSKGGDGKHVLLTKSDRPYVRRDLVNGRVRRADDFQSMYTLLAQKLRWKKPMKQLRKTSASLLESHPVYGRLTSLFLGHAPASMKDKHYAAVPQDLFDEAVAWLAKQYGFVEGA